MVEFSQPGITGGEDKPRVAVFLPNLAGGGAERVMVTLCNAFARRGMRVALVVARREGPYLAEVESEVDVVDLGTRTVLAAALPLARFLRDARPVVLLSALAHANMTAIVARRLSGQATRLVISERNTLSEVIKRSRRPFAALLPLAMRLIYPRADGHIAISNGVADDLARTIGFPRERITVVYNPAASDDVRRGSSVKLEHHWFASNSPPVVLAVGRFTLAKDHACLLDAFALLRERRACRLVILGEGPLRPALESRATTLGIAEDVLMPGFQSNPFNWMRNAAAFVLSSRNEGFANVLVEAMACGTPVVSTDCPSGPAEILENGKWGRLVPVGNAAAMADAIAATLDDTQPPDVETRAADFSVDRAVEGYARVLGLSL